jgi:hypothetical protein
MQAGLRGYQAVGNETGLAEGLEGLAALAAAAGQAEQAARLLAASAQLRARLERPLPPLEAAALESFRERLMAQMDAATFQDAWVAGEGLSREAALAEALAVGDDLPPPPPP